MAMPLPQPQRPAQYTGKSWSEWIMMVGAYEQRRGNNNTTIYVAPGTDYHVTPAPQWLDPNIRQIGAPSATNTRTTKRQAGSRLFGGNGRAQREQQEISARLSAELQKFIGAATAAKAIFENSRQYDRLMIDYHAKTKVAAEISRLAAHNEAKTDDRLLFRHGNEIKVAVLTAQVRQMTAATFAREVVYPIITADIQRLPAKFVANESWYVKQAAAAVSKAARGYAIVKAGGNVYVIPEGLLQTLAAGAERTAALKQVLPRYTYVEDFRLEPGQVIVRDADGKHFLAPATMLDMVQADIDKAIVLTRDNADRIVRRPALTPLDLDRYKRLRNLDVVEPDELIVTPAGECIVAVGADMYRASRTVPAGGTGCRRFFNSQERDWQTISPKDKLTVAEPKATLGAGKYLLANTSQEIVLCSDLDWNVPGPVTGLTAVRVGGRIAGAANLQMLSPVTVDTLIDEGLLQPAKVTVTGSPPMSLVSTDLASNTVTIYQEVMRITSGRPFSAPAGYKQLERIASAGEALVAGTDDSGDTLILRELGTVQLWPGIGLCSFGDSQLVSYSDADPGWEDCVYLEVTQDFDLESSSVLVKDAGGEFLGYANNTVALPAWDTSLELTTQDDTYTTYCYLRVHEADGADAGERDVVMRGSDYDGGLSSPFEVLPVRVNPAPAEYAQNPAGWFRADSAADGSQVLCQFTGGDPLWWRPDLAG